MVGAIEICMHIYDIERAHNEHTCKFIKVLT